MPSTFNWPIVESTPAAQSSPAISFSADAYARQLRELLPPGAAFSPEDDSEISATLQALAQELARVDARGVDLINESDPRTANETITDWERVLKLPDDRVTVIPATLAERQIAITQKYANRGGQNVDFFVKLCALCGYTLAAGSLPTPAPSFGAQVTTGGSLHNGVTVSYRVSAYNFQGETIASVAISRVLTGATNTNQQPISWNAIPGARGYRVYGRTSGSEHYMGQVIDNGSLTFSFTDDGSITPTSAPPVVNTATYPAIEKFALKVARTGPSRCGDPLDGAAWAYAQRLNLQPPVGTVLNQASFERVIRHATHSHIVDVFVYH